MEMASRPGIHQCNNIHIGNASASQHLVNVVVRGIETKHLVFRIRDNLRSAGCMHVDVWRRERGP
jgi:hypothetical protein